MEYVELGLGEDLAAEGGLPDAARTKEDVEGRYPAQGPFYRPDLPFPVKEAGEGREGVFGRQLSPLFHVLCFGRRDGRTR